MIASIFHTILTKFNASEQYQYIDELIETKTDEMILRSNTIHNRYSRKKGSFVFPIFYTFDAASLRNKQIEFHRIGTLLKPLPFQSINCLSIIVLRVKLNESNDS